MTEWTDALDVYEASLGHHQQLADADVVDGPNPWPPAELPAGPVPDELRERAAALLEQSNQLIDGLAAKLANIPPRKPGRYSHPATREHPRWTKSL